MTSDEEQTPFEKPGGPPTKPSGTGRVPLGVWLGLALAVLVILGGVLFGAASCAGGGGNGQTTGVVLLLGPLP